MLVGIVSSKRLMDKSSIRTMSGLAWVVLMLVGIVAEEDSEAYYLSILHHYYRLLL